MKAMFAMRLTKNKAVDFSTLKINEVKDKYMSRSEPALKKPTTLKIEWSGKYGRLEYWDKERGEKGENVTVPFPFRFLVLDELATMGGYCKSDDSGYWSNEVRNTMKQPFVVRTKQGIKETAVYKQLVDVTRKGAKYATSVYIGFYEGEGEDKKLVIGNMKFIGASLSSWIDFKKTCNVEKGCVIVTGKSDLKTNGDTKYYEPVFSYNAQISPETEQAAVGLDRELQTYLRAYFALQGQEQESVSADNGGNSNDSYFDQRNRELDDFSDKEVKPEHDTFDGKPPIEDSDIPFALIFAFIGLAMYLVMHGQPFA